jgi:integrase
MVEHGDQPDGADPKLTVERLATIYLNDCRGRLESNNLRVAEWFLKTFVELYGPRRVKDLRAMHLDAWVRQHPTWGQSTESGAKSRIVAMIRWGVDQGIVAANPIRGLKRPPIRSRGAQTIIRPEDHEKLVQACSQALRMVLTALHQTGARPSEVVGVTAAEFDAERGLWILERHKTDHNGRRRVVFLTPELTALCRELAIKHPTGPLFRTAHGQPWPRGTIHKLVYKLRKKLGLPDTVTAYGYRHTFATDALARGVPEAHVAELLGHYGTAMLHRHYSHLSARIDTLRAALGNVR